MIKNLYTVPESFAVAAQVKRGDYDRMYAESVLDPERFWGDIGRRIDWIKNFTHVKDSSYAHDDCHIRWFYDGKLNVSSNCLDRNCKPAAIKPRSFGRVMIRIFRSTSATVNCTSVSANARTL